MPQKPDFPEEGSELFFPRTKTRKGVEKELVELKLVIIWIKPCNAD